MMMMMMMMMNLCLPHSSWPQPVTALLLMMREGFLSAPQPITALPLMMREGLFLSAGRTQPLPLGPKQHGVRFSTLLLIFLLRHSFTSSLLFSTFYFMSTSLPSFVLSSSASSPFLKSFFPILSFPFTSLPCFFPSPYISPFLPFSHCFPIHSPPFNFLSSPSPSFPFLLLNCLSCPLFLFASSLPSLSYRKMTLQNTKLMILGT